MDITNFGFQLGGINRNAPDNSAADFIFENNDICLQVLEIIFSSEIIQKPFIARYEVVNAPV